MPAIHNASTNAMIGNGDKADIPVLPSAFTDRMSTLLGDDYGAFIASYMQERTYGLRINPLKISASDIEELNHLFGDDAAVKPVSDKVAWCEEGYYYNKDSCPGRSPFHEAGAYYIQEPSAMSVVTALDPKPGERICDLCAAPGGKTTHIAGRMQGRGVLISNEIVPERARVLSQNVERMGIANCVVTCASPDVLANRFAGYFDRVCVDAPCSGEGMFRKDAESITQWSVDNVSVCAVRQRDIIEAAASMVRPGGVMVYSTCTFEVEENEAVISDFLSGHQEWRAEDTARIWPHRSRGEGHFVAKLVRDGYPGTNDAADNVYLNTRKINKRSGKARNEDLDVKNVQCFKESLRFLHTGLLNDKGMEYIFGETEATNDILRRIIDNNSYLYLLPKGVSDKDFRDIRVQRFGMEICEIKKSRFEPSHALAMSLRPEHVHNACNLSYDDAVRFLRGETIALNDDKCNILNGAWVLVCIKGVSIGWAKYVGGILKNHYPKGLRRDLMLR